jgi:hypothetical protein
MERTPKQIIEAILANLEMAHSAKRHRADVAILDKARARHEGAADAYQNAIALIRTEADKILNPPIIRHLSDGTPVEMVKPWSEGANL